MSQNEEIVLFHDGKELLRCVTWTYLKSFVEEHWAHCKNELWVHINEHIKTYEEIEKAFEVKPYYTTNMAANDRFR